MMQCDFLLKTRRGRGSSGLLATVAMVALMASTGGCQGIEGPVEESAVGSDRYEEGGSCPPWSCGTNNPMLNGTEVGEIDLDGSAGNGGFEFVKFISPLVLSLSLDVVDGEFVGTDILGNEHDGSELEGGIIVLRRLSDLSLHALVIEDFDHVDSWTDPVHSVPAYRFLSATISILDVLGTTSDTCDTGEWVPYIDEAFSEYYAVLIGDERYDPATKTVTASGASADRWFNIACNGHALAKMKLLGYDPEYEDTSTTFESTTAERQATLKMITADYCGTGTAFTVAGQPLIAENADGTALLASSGAVIDTSESIWTADGALCLDVARRAAAESGIQSDIEDECDTAEHDLPACDDFLPDWESEGLWRTWNPE